MPAEKQEILEHDLRLSIAKKAGKNEFLKAFGKSPEATNILNFLDNQFSFLSPEQMENALTDIANKGYVGRSVYDGLKNGLAFFQSDAPRGLSSDDLGTTMNLGSQKAINPYSIEQRRLLFNAADRYFDVANKVMESDDFYEEMLLVKAADEEKRTVKKSEAIERKVKGSQFTEPQALERIEKFFEQQVPNPENEIYVKRINSLLTNVNSEQGLEKAGAYILAVGRDKVIGTANGGSFLDEAKAFLQKLPKMVEFMEAHPEIDLEHGEQAKKFPNKEQKALTELEDRLKKGELNPTKKGKNAFFKFFNNRIVSDEGIEKAITLIRAAGEKTGTAAKTEALLQDISATSHYITQHPHLAKEIPAPTQSPQTVAKEEITPAAPTPSVNPIIPFPTPTAEEEASALKGLTEFWTKNEIKPSLHKYMPQFFNHIGESGMEKAISIIKDAAPQNRDGENAANKLIAKIPTAQQFVARSNPVLETHATPVDQEVPVVPAAPQVSEQVAATNVAATQAPANIVVNVQTNAAEVAKATALMEQAKQMMAEAQAILEKLASGVPKTLLAFNVAAIPTGILADKSEAETKISELLKNGTLSQDAASEYASMYAEVKGIQKLTGGIEPTLGHEKFMEWANKNHVPSSLFVDLDPTTVSQQQKKQGIPHRLIYDEIAMSTPKFPMQDAKHIYHGLGSAKGDGRGLA